MKQKHWLEPMEKWIKDAGNMEKIALDSNLLNKKVAAKEIFGSNLLLQNKSVRASAPNFENSLANSSETAWATLRVAHSFVNSKPESFIREPSVGIGPTVSSLPMTCFTTKLQRHLAILVYFGSFCKKTLLYMHFDIGAFIFNLHEKHDERPEENEDCSNEKYIIISVHLRF